MEDLDELRDAARALDRVIIFGCYQVPDLFSPATRVSVGQVRHPKVPPKYYTDRDASGLAAAWAIVAWWDKCARQEVAGGA